MQSPSSSPSSSHRTLAWAAESSHIGGVPRRIVFATIGCLSKLVTSFLNTTRVYNMEVLTRFVTDRPPGLPLITVSNHMTTLDDPFMWGLRDFKVTPALARWTLAADDICFTNPIFSYFFRLGKCIPITRGAGIYQLHMQEALEKINNGEWLHFFPEGKISQENAPIHRLKWGAASLIVRAKVPPVVLPICHSGFEKVMPESYCFGRRPLLPLCFKNISIVVGEPIQYDIPSLIEAAKAELRKGYQFQVKGSSMHIYEDQVLKWVYSSLLEQIQVVLQELFSKAKSLNAKVASYR